MEDIKIWRLCKDCAKPLTIMESCRGDDRGEDKHTTNSYLVIRCLNCGQHPVEEIARLDANQLELNK